MLRSSRRPTVRGSALRCSNSMRRNGTPRSEALQRVDGGDGTELVGFLCDGISHQVGEHFGIDGYPSIDHDIGMFRLTIRR